MSRQKAVYLRDLAAHVANKSLNFHRFARMSDDEIIGDLTRVKGIGRWTAEIFLMFNLGRPDVLPLDDLGLRIAARQAYRLADLPSKRELEKMGERWRPYRTAASVVSVAEHAHRPARRQRPGATRSPRSEREASAERLAPAEIQ